MRRTKEALVQYTHAISLAPNSTLARFRRARTLMTLQLYPDAMTELNQLVHLAPEEANVWYMLGRCHKAMGNRSETVKCFTTSLNLDAKVRNISVSTGMNTDTSPGGAVHQGCDGSN